jgi:hypothetical protein
MREEGGANAGPAATSYSDHRPYPAPPEHWNDLAGPVTGHLELPRSMDWGPPRTYDLADPTDRCILYERVLREASGSEELCAWVHGPSLAALWARLWLPQRVRDAWEDRFPELRSVA